MEHTFTFFHFVLGILRRMKYRWHCISNVSEYRYILRLEKKAADIFLNVHVEVKVLLLFCILKVSDLHKTTEGLCLTLRTSFFLRYMEEIN